jgi:hypothetical protein
MQYRTTRKQQWEKSAWRNPGLWLILLQILSKPYCNISTETIAPGNSDYAHCGY